MQTLEQYWNTLQKKEIAPNYFLQSFKEGDFQVIKKTPNVRLKGKDIVRVIGHKCPICNSVIEELQHMRPALCDYCDAHLLLKGAIISATWFEYSE